MEEDENKISLDVDLFRGTSAKRIVEDKQFYLWPGTALGPSSLPYKNHSNGSMKFNCERDFLMPRVVHVQRLLSTSIFVSCLLGNEWSEKSLRMPSSRRRLVTRWTRWRFSLSACCATHSWISGATADDWVTFTGGAHVAVESTSLEWTFFPLLFCVWLFSLLFSFVWGLWWDRCVCRRYRKPIFSLLPIVLFKIVNWWWDNDGNMCVHS